MEHESDETYLLLSGMKVVNEIGTFYFSEPGEWVDSTGYPFVHKLHRKDGPAAIYNVGNIKWFLNGELHRTDGPAAEYANGTKLWYLNGRLHRTDGPAVEWTGDPAAEYANGNGEWWEHGKRIG